MFGRKRMTLPEYETAYRVLVEMINARQFPSPSLVEARRMVADDIAQKKLLG